MKKWLMLMSAGVVLTACGTSEQENEAPAETEETAEVESGDSQTSSSTDSQSQSQETTETESTQSEEESNESTESSSDTTQTAIYEARTQLNEGETDQAALTIRTLEEQNGENFTEEESSQVEELKQAIDNEKATQTENNQPSNYQEVRESTVVNENYQESTGENLNNASDEEVESWLSEEESTDSQNSSQQNSDDQTQNQNQNQDSSDNQTATVQELENYALEQVTEQTGLLDENYTYFTDLQEDNWVQVEIREQHSDGEVGWTTMVGFYRYNVETDTLETMDPITGEFN